MKTWQRKGYAAPGARPCGTAKASLPQLRNTFATLALQNGVDIKTVSGMLGHYSAGFTLDTYTHVTTLAQTKAAETMGGLLANAVRQPSQEEMRSANYYISEI